jgi:hypothetical protein
VKTVSNHLRHLAMLATVAAGLLPPAAAQAQYYAATAQPQPLYPYAVQADQPYAVQVAPNTYVIQRPAGSRAYPYVRGRASNPVAEPSTPKFDRPPKPAERALIEELRKRSQTKRTVIETKKIVRDAPVVVETKRYVDDPPRVIERRHVVEDAPPARPRRQQATVEESDTGKRAGRDDNKKRVIEADAEVTILGPDRMSIRLFRKGQGGSKANARAE